jgi:hypothetical protein
MSSIMISDLRNSTELDSHAMSAVRGGFAWGSDVKVNLNVDQKIVQFQDVQAYVLNNNGLIGAGFVGPSLNLDVAQKASNSAVVPTFL